VGLLDHLIHYLSMIANSMSMLWMEWLVNIIINVKWTSYEVQRGKDLELKVLHLVLYFVQSTTSQIYKLHEFVPNPCEICYFMGSYCLHMNVMNYLNT
jgi:hypothetical protein